MALSALPKQASSYNIGKTFQNFCTLNWNRIQFPQWAVCAYAISISAQLSCTYVRRAIGVRFARPEVCVTAKFSANIYMSAEGN